MIPLFDQNPVRTRPVVTRWLIYANVLAYLGKWWVESEGATWISAGYGMVPSRLFADPQGEWIKVFSSMFLHADFMHLLWNMVFLHIFGDNLEDALGRVRFSLFYLAAGVCGALGQYFVGPHSTLPMIGASGAIAGVLGGYLVLYPRAPITILNPVILLWLVMGPFLVLPAWAVVGWWFLGNVVGAVTSLGSQAAGTAFFAHLGGFVFGLLAIRPALPKATQVEHPWNGLRSPARVARPKIFKKADDGPFWHD